MMRVNGWRAAILLALTVLVVSGVVWVSRTLAPEHTQVHVVYRRYAGGALPFLAAAESGLFTSRGLDVLLARVPTAAEAAIGTNWIDLLGQLANGEYEIVAGCPSRVVSEAVAREPERWKWFGAGFETALGEPMSAVYARRSAGIDDVSILEHLLESEHGKLLVPDDLWGQESHQIWQFLNSSNIVVLEPFTADGFAEHEAVAVFGGTAVLVALERDPRFVRLAVNLRAARLGDPYWACAHLARRDFAEAHSTTMHAVASAIDETFQTMLEQPGQKLGFLRRKLGLVTSDGEKLGKPSYLPMKEARIDGIAGPLIGGRSDAMVAVRRAQVAFGSSASRPPPCESVASGSSAGRPKVVRDVPPFSAPKPKDVFLHSGP